MSQLNQIALEVQHGSIGNYNTQKYSHLPQQFIQVQNGFIKFQPIVNYLKDMGLTLADNMISYYSHINNLFVHIGHDPLPENTKISLQDTSQTIQLKFRSRPYSDTIHKYVKFSQQEDDINTKNLGSRRTKERKIGYIIEKVAQWRRLYNGIVNDSGETVKCSLDQAAQYIGISKKSLDDYLLQLRFGRRYGFNFHEHKQEKVGILRTYVKKYKQIEAQLKELWPDRFPSAQLMEELRNSGTPACVDGNCCVPPSNVIRIPIPIKD